MHSGSSYGPLCYNSQGAREALDRVMVRQYIVYSTSNAEMGFDDVGGRNVPRLHGSTLGPNRAPRCKGAFLSVSWASLRGDDAPASGSAGSACACNLGQRAKRMTAGSRKRPTGEPWHTRGAVPEKKTTPPPSPPPPVVLMKKSGPGPARQPSTFSRAPESFSSWFHQRSAAVQVPLRTAARSGEKDGGRRKTKREKKKKKKKKKKENLRAPTDCTDDVYVR